jgi:cytochrome b561
MAGRRDHSLEHVRAGAHRRHARPVHDSWPDATQAFWINIHAIIGLAVWLLLIARAVWRWRHPPPALPAGSRRILAPRVRRSCMVALYALLFVIPIIGIVTFIWHGRISTSAFSK